MSKEVSFRNRDRFLQLGHRHCGAAENSRHVPGAAAEKAEISRSLLSSIEAPGLAKGFSLEVFFNLADALEVDPADLLRANLFPDQRADKKEK